MLLAAEVATVEVEPLSPRVGPDRSAETDSASPLNFALASDVIAMAPGMLAMTHLQLSTVATVDVTPAAFASGTLNVANISGRDSDAISAPAKSFFFIRSP